MKSLNCFYFSFLYLSNFFRFGSVCIYNIIIVYRVYVGDLLFYKWIKLVGLGNETEGNDSDE